MKLLRVEYSQTIGMLDLHVAYFDGSAGVVTVKEPDDGAVLVGVDIDSAAWYLTRKYWPLVDFGWQISANRLTT